MTPKPPRPVLPGQLWHVANYGFTRHFGPSTLRIESIDGPIANCTQVSTGRACKVAVSTLRSGKRGARLLQEGAQP